MVELKRIGVMSMAKLEAVIMAVVGLIMGLFVALFGALGAMMPGSEAGLLGMGLGIFAVVALPIGYAIFGFISGAIGAAIYNVFAGFIGGVRLGLGGKESTRPARR